MSKRPATFVCWRKRGVKEFLLEHFAWCHGLKGYLLLCIMDYWRGMSFALNMCYDERSTMAYDYGVSVLLWNVQSYTNARDWGSGFGSMR
jgi:hypothetical protein